MIKIVLQPASNQKAFQHFIDTIKKPVPISSMASFLSAEELEILNSLYSSGVCPVWGVTPGEDNINENKWKKIEAGDVGLFARKKMIFSSGVVTYKIQNSDLAAHLWGWADNGMTWEFIYFLDEIKEHEITYEAFNTLVGYKADYNIQGFNVLDEDKSISFLNEFDLISYKYNFNSSESLTSLLNRLKKAGKTDAETISYRRLEQTYLRKMLFSGRKTETCALCNEEYEIEFLTTAHIKKRATCTLEERLDKNVVIPVCKFGCDELFEKGYIGVKDGKIVSIKPAVTVVVKGRIYMLVQKQTFSYFDEKANKAFFEAHLKYHGYTE